MNLRKTFPLSLWEKAGVSEWFGLGDEYRSCVFGLALDTVPKSGIIVASREQFCTVGFPNAFQKEQDFLLRFPYFSLYLYGRRKKGTLVISVSFSDLEIKDDDLEGCRKRPARMIFIAHVIFSIRRF